MCKFQSITEQGIRCFVKGEAYCPYEGAEDDCPDYEETEPECNCDAGERPWRDCPKCENE